MPGGPDSFTAPCPTPEPRARYAPALAGSRDPPRTCAEEAGLRARDRSRMGTRSAAGRRTRHADVKSRHRRRARPPRIETGTKLSTPLPRDDCGYGHTTGPRGYRRNEAHGPPRPHPCSSTAVHSCIRAIGPGSGDTAPSARPAWPRHRRRTYPPLGGAADHVARNGVRSDVGRLCRTPGAVGPDLRPPHRPSCPAPVAESAQRDTRGQHSRRSTLNGRGHLGRWTLQA